MEDHGHRQPLRGLDFFLVGYVRAFVDAPLYSSVMSATPKENTSCGHSSAKTPMFHSARTGWRVILAPSAFNRSSILS
jgi:hypothetical protein